METLERGDSIGFLFDQEAVYGPYIPFFGREACTHKTPAVLARDHRVPVFFGVMVRRGDYLHYDARGELVPIPPATDDKDADIRAILGELVARLENEIRRRPEQYLWAHRRWKRAGAHGERFIPPGKQKSGKQKTPEKQT
jgi:KDO2-lipid IV(A) lauroyltransferase